ncbi:MAG: hypothetical protein F6K34_11660 [Okeania sp. SIO4D6]|nr:hypothetical protein [Okeania sp. SIO4D6]
MTFSRHDAQQEWNKIPDKIEKGLKTAPRDLCALECLANDPLYAKPDSEKIFLLWEAKNESKIDMGQDQQIEGIRIECIEGINQKHPWVVKLFFGDNFVRFPFNTWDALLGDGDETSLNWLSIHEYLLPNKIKDPKQFKVYPFYSLPRWSTASRSCFALIST